MFGTSKKTGTSDFLLKISVATCKIWMFLIFFSHFCCFCVRSYFSGGGWGWVLGPLRIRGEPTILIMRVFS